MKHNLLYINCPICGKQLININMDNSPRFHNYWCDECEVDIDIDTHEGGNDEDEDAQRLRPGA